MTIQVEKKEYTTKTEIIGTDIFLTFIRESEYNRELVNRQCVYCSDTFTPQTVRFLLRF